VVVCCHGSVVVVDESGSTVVVVVDRGFGAGEVVVVRGGALVEVRAGAPDGDDDVDEDDEVAPLPAGRGRRRRTVVVERHEPGQVKVVDAVVMLVCNATPRWTMGV
jgi:hypothetical protein